MRVIDLLNKIANGEEVPKKIKWEDTIYAYSDYDKDYLEFPFSEEEYQGLFCMKDSILTQFLDDEVEIIEEPQPTEEEINEYTNKFLEAWEPISKQFGKLFDALIRIKNDLGLNLEENTKEPQEHKIPEKLSYILHVDDNIAEIPSNEMLMNKINEIIDYLGDKE